MTSMESGQPDAEPDVLVENHTAGRRGIVQRICICFSLPTSGKFLAQEESSSTTRVGEENHNHPPPPLESSMLFRDALAESPADPNPPRRPAVHGFRQPKAAGKERVVFGHFSLQAKESGASTRMGTRPESTRASSPPIKRPASGPPTHDPFETFHGTSLSCFQSDRLTYPSEPL